MENTRRIASHEGTVMDTREGFVTVQIQSVSACATCQAHARCGFAESKNKTLDLPTSDWSSYHAGDRVVVQIDESRGLQAVWIAYMLPALLLLAVIITLSLLHLPEWAVAIAAFSTLALYILILYLYRNKVEKQFELKIVK